jgi:hypothetical protein
VRTHAEGENATASSDEENETPIVESSSECLCAVGAQYFKGDVETDAVESFCFKLIRRRPVALLASRGVTRVNYRQVPLSSSSRVAVKKLLEVVSDVQC